MTTDRQRLIADALGRTPRTIVEIDDGYDFKVAIVDDEWVFRFPRRPGVEEALKLEIAILPALAPALPVDVPSFEHVSGDPLFVGYRLIRGDPLVGEDSDGARAFLEALHGLDPAALHVFDHLAGSPTPNPRFGPRPTRLVRPPGQLSIMGNGARFRDYP